MRPDPAPVPVRAGRRPALAALALVAAVGGCGKKTTLSVKVYAPTGAADPFASAARVRMTVGEQLADAEVSGGKFDVSVELDSPKSDTFQHLVLEAFDAGGAVIGRGRTPDFQITADNYQVGVFVGRTGQVSPTDLYLPDDLAAGATTPPLPAALGRTGVQATALRGRQVSPAEPGYGALIAGGVGEGGRIFGGAWLYQALTHQLIDAGTLLAPRQGGVLLPSADSSVGQEAVLVGGANSGGMLLSSAEKFSPRVSAKSQLWAAPAGDVTELVKPGLLAPAVAELFLSGGPVPDSVFLVAGGSEDGAGLVPSAQAALVRRFPAPDGATDTSPRPGVKPIAPPQGQAAPMLASRSGHSATAVSATAAILFGGLTRADETAGKPVAERFSLEKTAFERVDLKPAVPSRRGHVALKLKSGRVLIAGGYVDDGSGKPQALRSALVLNPNDLTVEERPTLLTTARYAAAIAAVDNDVLICGGYDTSGSPLADCELLKNEQPGEALAMMTQSVALPRPRAEHVMVTLENGLVLLIGGAGEGKRPIAAIDFYVPR